MFSSLLSIDNALSTFFNQLTDTIGFAGYLGVFLAVEVLFIIIFGIRASLSYEARLKRNLDKANQWLFKNKVIDTKNIKAFNEVMRRGPKRLTYFWQQYILYREGAPSMYMNIDNIIEKPLKSSGWASSVKNLGICTAVWSAIALIFGIASQNLEAWSYLPVAVALVLPISVILVGAIAIIIIKSVRTVNLDDLYHMFHLFTRFVDNACAELPPYIDFDLLFTAKEIEHGNPQLREYYEARARKAKEEFENAKNNDVKHSEYNFRDVGVEGALLLDRAMKESETYINKKTATLASIAQAESQKEALRRNYENVQMDLQRKIQASKENIQKLIEQQAATTSRIEVGLLRQQQEKESKKQEALQKDYDAEEARYKMAKADLDKEVEALSKVLVQSLDEAERGMSSEYQTFYEKVMKSAYALAEKKAEDEKKELKKLADKHEQELINVQTQIKRLMDENLTLREQLESLNPEFKEETQNNEQGHYDEEGNFVYADGSYHSPDGLFHDVDGKIYDMNGVEVTEEVTEEGATVEAIMNEQVEQFGSAVPTEENAVTEDAQTEDATDTQEAEAEPQAQEETAEEPAQPEETVVENQEENPVATEPQAEEETAEVEQVPEAEESEVAPDVVTEEKAQEPAQTQPDQQAEQPTEEKSKQDAPAKKRGRPRKDATADEEKKEAPKTSRGRPRKTTSQDAKTEQPKKTRGRPRKTTAETEVKEESPAKKRGRPRKTTVPATSNSTGAKRGRPKGTTKKETPVPETEPKKRGRPRKSPILGEDIDSLSKISQLINEEEAKLNKMKALLNSEIDEVMKQEELETVDKEREELIKAVEALKAQAQTAETKKSDEELASINKRLEDLIKEISVLNDRK